MAGCDDGGRRVHPHVAVEVARLGEAESAEAALVGLLAGVDPQVLRQRARVGKGLLALPTPAEFAQYRVTVWTGGDFTTTFCQLYLDCSSACRVWLG